MTAARMKYMGSKRAMLKNGLGVLLQRETRPQARFFDLFAGSGSVAVHVAKTTPMSVHSCDLQSYSSVVSGAIIERTSAFDPNPIWERWVSQARDYLEGCQLPDFGSVTPESVAVSRIWSAEQKNLPITAAYGGHYFSPLQTVWIDALRSTAPKDQHVQKVALAALVHAASQCAAAPGHTAQPFQPTSTALPYLREAWGRDFRHRTSELFAQLATEHANTLGAAFVGDANSAALELKEGDLAFIDPPYSGVHYSRFYHVLETVAQGRCGEVSGVGRYPVSDLRPRSDYSMRTTSVAALSQLLGRVASKGAGAVLTFPDHACSNGLSGDAVREIAAKYFRVAESGIDSKFSTLGGHGSGESRIGGRAARQHATELVLVLRP